MNIAGARLGDRGKTMASDIRFGGAALERSYYRLAGRRTSHAKPTKQVK